MENQYYIDEYASTRGLKNTTREKTGRILNHYSSYQKMSLHDLLNEADMEEEAGIRWKRRVIKQRLINYMNYLKEQMLLSSAKTYFNAIITFYRHHEIEIGTLPKFNPKNARLPEPITSKDMLTKEIIREALKVATPVMRCIILTEASSGMTRSDVLSLTIGDFLEATHQYHMSNNIQVAVDIMLQEDLDIIPIFRLRRSKTNKYFITFISPEATIEICKYLKLRDKRNKKYHRNLLSNVDKLFKIHEATYTDKFGEINNQLNTGKAGTYNKIRGHMLRKWNATQLEKHGMSRYLVNVLQGKSNNAVDDVYFIEDEEHLRNEYLQALDGVLIYTDVKQIDKYSPEYHRLEKENKELKDTHEKLNDLIRRMEILEQGE